MDVPSFSRAKVSLAGGNWENDVGRCPVCLEVVADEAYTDSCKHRFCFACILQWSEYEASKAEAAAGSKRKLEGAACPLCKTLFTCVIHDFSNGDSMRHYLTAEGSSDRPYQLSEAHRRRRAIYFQRNDGRLQQGETSSSMGMPNTANAAARKRRMEDTYRWVTRELQALMQEEDVELIVQHVLGILEAFERPKRQRRDEKILSSERSWKLVIAEAVGPFVFEHSKKFAEELSKFIHGGETSVQIDVNRENSDNVRGVGSLSHHYLGAYEQTEERREPAYMGPVTVTERNGKEQEGGTWQQDQWQQDDEERSEEDGGRWDSETLDSDW